MVKLFVLCGAPGSGKTTKSKEIAEEYNCNRCSFDELKCITHDELIPHILKSLDENNNTVVDGLYVRNKWRIDIIQATQHIECKKILIYMDTLKEECVRRNAQRNNSLSTFMVESIYNSIELPTLAEGWDEIIYI